MDLAKLQAERLKAADELSKVCKHLLSLETRIVQGEDLFATARHIDGANRDFIPLGPGAVRMLILMELGYRPGQLGGMGTVLEHVKRNPAQKVETPKK